MLRREWGEVVTVTAEKSKIGFTGLNWRCRQAALLLETLRENLFPGPSPRLAAATFLGLWPLLFSKPQRWTGSSAAFSLVLHPIFSFTLKDP